MATHEPTLANVQLLRTGDIAPMRVGEFSLAPGEPAAMDRSVSVRAGTMSSPDGGSFARYLSETLTTELRAAGKLDPNSAIVVSGLLSESRVDSNMPKGSAALGAAFSVSRDGVVVYQKTLHVEEQWDSAFIGAIAIPAAFDGYTALYAQLVGALLADKDFRTAAARH